MEDDRDIVVFSDDDGNEFELEVIDYFDYEDQEYAVLVDPTTCECDDEDCECETEVYIMKVLVNGDMEEFLPADDDKMEALSEIVEERLASLDEACECECECECECDCDCDEDCDDGCGCDDKD